VVGSADRAFNYRGRRRNACSIWTRGRQSRGRRCRPPLRIAII